jgi:GNAT superfamily N-acetyltransferase
MMGDMLSSKSLFRLVCRPALPKDTPEVMELTRTIWNGEDYVPSVWSDWYSDPDGLLAIAEFGGIVVGLGKLSRIAPYEWWLEGLRVHPDYEGRGIASHLHDYLLRFWLKNGGGAIRLVTASFRTPVHRICERTGFRKLGEFTPFLAPSIDLNSGGQQEDRLTLIDVNQIEIAFKAILASPISSLTAGLMDLSWQWVTPSIELIRQAIIREQVYWWQDKRGVLVISEDDERETRTSMIQIIACQHEDLVELLQDYRKLATHLGFNQAGWVAPLHSELEPLLHQAGFQRDWDASLFVFERRHPNA